MKRSIIFICFWLLAITYGSAQLITNGDFEIGPGGTAVMPTGWNVINGTPDHCNKVSLCTGCYLIANDSPQGGKWIRFSRVTPVPPPGLTLFPSNEMFGQLLTAKLIPGETYTISFYAASSAEDSFAAVNPTMIIFGFSHGMQGNVGLEHRDTAFIDTVEKWQYFSFTFIADNDYDYISFGEAEDGPELNASYLDGLQVKKDRTTCDFDLGYDTTLCEGESIVLRTGLPGASHLWSDGSGYDSIKVTTPGLYWVKIKTNQCMNEDTIMIDFDPAPLVNLGNDTAMCPGNKLLLDATYHHTGVTYTWQDASISPSFLVNDSGKYYVELAIGDCTVSDSINIGIVSLPTVSLGNDTSLCLGDKLTWELANDGTIYTWQNGEHDSIFSATSTGNYTLSAKNTCGESRDEINIYFNDCSCNVYFPNTFTPDNDGINDVFRAISQCTIENYHLVIFNRWGEVIYESNEATEGWNGQNTTSGSYIYHFKGITHGKQLYNIIGKVNLLR